MGGKKKKTIKAMEKESLRKKREKVEEKKKREDKEVRKSTIPASVDISVIENIKKDLNNMNYLTPYSIYSKYGLKIGDAKRILKILCSEGIIKSVGGNARIQIYVPSS